MQVSGRWYVLEIRSNLCQTAPLISASEAARRGEQSVFGDRTIDFAAVCEEWPKGKVSPEFRDPIIPASGFPVLIFSGELKRFHYPALACGEGVRKPHERYPLDLFRYGAR